MKIVSRHIRASARIEDCTVKKEIPGFQGYFADTQGNIYSGFSKKNISISTDKKGYSRVQIYNDYGICKRVTVHRLVALAFIDNPENKPQVNHINEIKSDNRPSNLEWATASENIRHSQSKEVLLLSPCGEVVSVDCLTEFANKLGLSQGNLHMVVSGKVKHHKGWRNPKYSSGAFSGRIRGDFEYALISPLGVLHKFKNINAFSKRQSLTRSCVSRLLSGEIKTHKKWKLPNE